MEQSTAAKGKGSSPREPDIDCRALWSYLLLSIFVCGSFTAAAAVLLLMLYAFAQPRPDAAFLLKLSAKGVLFGAVMVAVVPWLRRAMPRIPMPPPSDPLINESASKWLVLVLPVLLLPALTLNSERYPHTEPDELHHIIVARNVAEYGAYATGHPLANLRTMDPEDSVGPTVILPVAAAIKVFGATLDAARGVMAVLFVLMLSVLFFFLRSSFGAGPALCGSLLCAVSWGSPYLGRTVYGEAPALAFLLAALIIWRDAIHRNRPIWALIIAGAFVGLALVTKTFATVCLWPALGVLLYDRLGPRQLRSIHFFVPAAAALIIPACWWTIVARLRDANAPVIPALLATYQHNLMFGFDSVPRTAAWFFRHGLYLVGGLIGIVFAAPRTMTRRYDPAGMMVLLTVPLLGFWWMFFTTGNIPRYLWYAIALAAALSGYALWRAGECLSRSRSRTAVRALCALVAVLVVAPAVVYATDQAARILFSDDMRDERELAAYIDRLPRDARIATTFWPVGRAVNFLADRPVQLLSDTGPVIEFEFVILNEPPREHPAEAFTPIAQFGKYVVCATRRL